MQRQLRQHLCPWRGKGGTYRGCHSRFCIHPLRNKDTVTSPQFPSHLHFFPGLGNSCRPGWKGHWHLEQPVLSAFSLLWPRSFPHAAPLKWPTLPGLLSFPTTLSAQIKADWTRRSLALTPVPSLTGCVPCSELFTFICLLPPL